ncbi:hypothetical protein VQL36_06675 [Chengkuizengella sp. SCS-71B]
MDVVGVSRGTLIGRTAKTGCFGASLSTRKWTILDVNINTFTTRMW